MANLSLKIPWQLRIEIERAAKEEKASMNQICIKAVKEYIERISQQKLIKHSKIEEAVDRRIKRMEDRLAALLWLREIKTNWKKYKNKIPWETEGDLDMNF